MEQCCFLTTLTTAIPYLHTNPDKNSKNQEQIFSKSLRLYKSQDKLAVPKPIKPPIGHSLSPRVRVKSISPINSNSIPKKPILDDLTLKYLEDPDKNVPGCIDDCVAVRNLLQQLLDFYLSEYNYKDSIMIKKCIVKINVEIFKYENMGESQNNTKINVNIIIERYMNFWDNQYSEFLDFCKKENTRLEDHQKNELDSCNAIKSEMPHPPRFSNSMRTNRPNKPLNLSKTLRPSDRSLIVPEQTSNSRRKRVRKVDNIKDRKDRIIDSQKYKINTFIEFSNEIRTFLIKYKKTFVNEIKRAGEEENERE